MLLHGLMSDSSTWDPAIGPLAEHGLRVIAPDLLGHGRSDKPRARYGLDFFAASVSELLMALGHTARHSGRSFSRRRNRGVLRSLPHRPAAPAGPRLERRPRPRSTPDPARRHGPRCQPHPPRDGQRADRSDVPGAAPAPLTATSARGRRQPEPDGSGAGLPRWPIGVLHRGPVGHVSARATRLDAGHGIPRPGRSDPHRVVREGRDHPGRPCVRRASPVAREHGSLCSPDPATSHIVGTRSDLPISWPASSATPVVSASGEITAG